MSLKIYKPIDSGERQSVSPPCHALLADALKEFACEPVPQGSGRRESRRQIARREKVTSTVDRFLDLMASDDAPKSEAEVIAALVPVGTWLLSWIVRQLVIQVLKFCWRKWSES